MIDHYKKCPICEEIIKKRKYKLKHDVYYCNNCSVFFKVTKDNEMTYPELFEDEGNTYEKVFKDLRLKDFKIIIPKIKSLLAHHNLKGLEIGSAHGWFIDEAEKNGFKMIGIEPQPINQKSNVYKGFFPKDLPQKEVNFDFIIFNHSLEHIYEIKETINNCKERLKKDGLLIINIPNSNGFFYKLSQFFYKLGNKKFLNRMWVFDYNCPHEFYFNDRSINYLMKNQEFVFLEKYPMHSVDLNSLRERIMIDETFKNKKTFALFASIIIKIIYPIINFLFPKDWLCYFYKKK